MPDLKAMLEIAGRGIDDLREIYGRAEDGLMPDGYGFGVRKRSEQEEAKFDAEVEAADPFMIGTLREAFKQLSMRHRPREAALKAAEIVQDRRANAKKRQAVPAPVSPARGPMVPPGAVTQGVAPGHAGVDFAGAKGRPVQADEDVAVFFTDSDPAEGNTVFVQYRDGRVRDLGHLDEVYVKPFQVVRAGTVIGTVGDTGRATAPHLHVGFGRPEKVTQEGGYGGDETV